MIRISEIEKDLCFLKYSSIDTYCPFNRFVERLGIDIRKYHQSSYDLLLNSVLVPSLSIQLPRDYYENWQNYPVHPKVLTEETIEYRWGVLHDMYWDTDKSEDEWYLHPFGRTKIAREYKFDDIRIPPQNGEVLNHSSGHKYSTINTYIPYWQVYRLFEIDYVADNTIKINMLLSPEKRIETMNTNCCYLIGEFEEKTAMIKEEWDRNYDELSSISSYRALHGICLAMEKRGKGNYHELVKEGAELLCKKLSMDNEKLEYCMREIYLKKYQNIGEKTSKNTQGLLVLMQKDIYYLTEWLCYINGKTFDYYFDKFENKSRFSDGYIDLINVLPFESEKEIKNNNILLAPYIEEINRHSTILKIDDNKYKFVFEVLREKCSSFYIFSRSLSRMHNEWNKDFDIEFNNSSLMDYLVLLSIKSETLLKELINQNEDHEMTLGKIIKKYSFLLSSGYEFRKGLDFCLEIWSKYTKSSTGFSKVPEFVNQTNLSNNDKWFAENILLFAQARNYFVHCYTYDNTNINLETLSMITKSIITSVLLLSCSYIDRIAEQSLQPDSAACHGLCYSR